MISNLRAIRALALEEWLALTEAQRAAMRVSSETLAYHHEAHGAAHTIAALCRREMCDEFGGLSAIGVLVREVGMAAEVVEARARFSAREAGAE